MPLPPSPFLFACTQQNKIINVAGIPLRTQFALGEMIQRVQVNKRVNLAHQVADWYANAFRPTHKQIHKAQCFRALDVPSIKPL